MKFLAVFFFLLPGTLSAADYYVSPAGSDSAPGTKEKPFATFKRGLDALKAGDTLNMAPGDYAGAGCKTLRGTRETVLKEYRGTADGKSWEPLDYKDFFPSDPEVRRRGMGLREAEVR